MATSTRYIGFCPVCESDIKVRDGLLVHHGYKRPGHGYIVGDCFGVHRPPHELSDATARAWRDGVAGMLAAKEGYLARLLGPNPPTTLYVEKWSREHHAYVPLPVNEADVSRHEWLTIRGRAISSAERDIQSYQVELARIQGLIDTWRPLPLRTVEEEVAKQTEARADRAARLTAARETKLAEAVVRLQQRIDSAVRNRNARTLADIYRDAGYKLASLSHGALGRDSGLRVLDRDHVWRAFGLLEDDKYLSGEDAQFILHAMGAMRRGDTEFHWRGQRHPALTWPDAMD